MTSSAPGLLSDIFSQDCKIVTLQWTSHPLWLLWHWNSHCYPLSLLTAVFTSHPLTLHPSLLSCLHYLIFQPSLTWDDANPFIMTDTASVSPRLCITIMLFLTSVIFFFILRLHIASPSWYFIQVPIVSPWKIWSGATSSILQISSLEGL